MLEHRQDFPETYERNGYHYELLGIKGKFALYKQINCANRPVALEFIALKQDKHKEGDIFKSKTPFILPNDNDWGKLGFTYPLSKEKEILSGLDIPF